MIRRIAKAALPPRVLAFVGGLRNSLRQRHLASLPIGHAFDEVYKRRMWAQGTSLSGPGSEGVWASRYATFVREYMREHECVVVCDAGCGDFEVGKLIATQARSYLAFDISPTIIEHNKAAYSEMKNVSFSVRNLLEDPIPMCDLLLVRQVLQHLTNAQIEKVLRNIESSPAKRVLICEHIYSPEGMGAANVDLEAHSVATRVERQSGVDIGAEPFNRARSIVATFESDGADFVPKDSVLRIYELHRPSPGA